jgi:hypothetical protein
LRKGNFTVRTVALKIFRNEFLAPLLRQTPSLFDAPINTLVRVPHPKHTCALFCSTSKAVCCQHPQPPDAWLLVCLPVPNRDVI